MSEPIKIGDLCVVLRAHCDTDPNIGKIFRVVEHWSHGYRCICGHMTYSGDAFSDGSNQCWERPWLKRIPPLDDLKGCSEDARQGQNDKVSA